MSKKYFDITTYGIDYYMFLKYLNVINKIIKC